MHLPLHECSVIARTEVLRSLALALSSATGLLGEDICILSVVSDADCTTVPPSCLER